MEVKVTVVLFLSFIFLQTILVTGDGKCSHTTCGQTRVQFPFALEGHQDRSCGYPGFNLSCDHETNGTVLDLGTLGKFSVRSINYTTQVIRLYDKDGCLPKRLMNFDLTDTPFMGIFHQSLDFYNCSFSFSFPLMEPITCLSTPKYRVYASPIYSRGLRNLFGTCQLFATATSIPVFEFYDGMGYLADITADLRLQWDAPNCGECVARGGTCKFKNRNKNEIACFNLPRRGLSMTARYVLGVGLGAPGLLFVLLMASYISGRVRSRAHGNNLRQTELSSSVSPQPPIFVVGLDEAVIQSYPKIVLGESRRLANPEDNVCAICLSAYQAKETLKTIPDCNHCFHAACIDQWLHRNVSCPLCRNSPPQLPMQPPV